MRHDLNFSTNVLPEHFARLDLRRVGEMAKPFVETGFVDLSTRGYFEPPDAAS
jgi:hypothetical protein